MGNLENAIDMGGRFYTQAEIDSSLAAKANTATTLSGYGITDAYTKTEVDAAVVHNTGNETIAGTKTFSSFPVTPSSEPTTDYQVANKKYVDDNSGISLATANSYDLGVGQTWQDVKASRSAGVTYTNTTGKPISLALTAADSSVSNIIIDGLPNIVIADSGSGDASSVSIIIPHNSTYVITGSKPAIWLELR